MSKINEFLFYIFITVVTVAFMSFIAWLVVYEVNDGEAKKEFWKTHDRLEVYSSDIDKLKQLYNEGWHYHSIFYNETVIYRDHMEKQ